MIKEYSTTCLEFLKKEWKFFVICVILVIGIGLAYHEYKAYQPVPQTVITEVSADQIADALAKLNVKGVDSKELTKEIQYVVTKEPQKVFYTETQEKADKQANVIAKQDNADFVIKQTNPTTDNDIKTANQQIKNNYYGVHMDYKAEILVGVSQIDGKTYWDAGVKANRVEGIAHMQGQSVKGASIMWSAIQIK